MLLDKSFPVSTESGWSRDQPLSKAIVIVKYYYNTVTHNDGVMDADAPDPIMFFVIPAMGE